MERILVRSLKLSEFNIQGFHFHIIHNLFYAKRRIIFHRSVIVLCQIQGCDWNLEDSDGCLYYFTHVELTRWKIMFHFQGTAYFHLFFLLHPQLEGVVSRSGRAVLLHLAAGHDPPRRLQFRHHYFEVKLCGKKNRHNLPKNTHVLLNVLSCLPFALLSGPASQPLR